jgi:hypothetical protein
VIAKKSPPGKDRQTRQAPGGPASGPLRPGDVVRLSHRHTGVIDRIIGQDAEVVEDTILGRRSTWRIRLAALRRA